MWENLSETDTRSSRNTSDTVYNVSDTSKLYNGKKKNNCEFWTLFMVQIGKAVQFIDNKAGLQGPIYKASLKTTAKDLHNNVLKEKALVFGRGQETGLLRPRRRKDRQENLTDRGQRSRFKLLLLLLLGIKRGKQGGERIN